MTSNVAVETVDLKKNFGSLEVLKGISLTVKKKEVVCVIGPSGSGKSTFLRCLNLLEKPTSGSVFIDGVDITSKDCDIDSVRANMGMVFQNFNLFPHRRVLDNIILAPMKVKKLQRDEAEEIAINLFSESRLERQSQELSR